MSNEQLSNINSINVVLQHPGLVKAHGYTVMHGGKAVAFVRLLHGSYQNASKHPRH
jgi:hypothetical protein